MMAKSTNTKPFYNDVIPSDWTTPEFGTVFSFLKSYAFSREQLVDEETEEGIQNIHYGDIHATFENEILDFELEKRIPFVKDGLIHNGKAEKEIDWLEDGDLIIADASEDYAGVAECIELKNVNGRKIVSGLHTFAARDKSGKSAQGYRTYLLNHPQVVRELRRIATGFSVFGISKTNITKVKLPLPPSKEQEEIADLLQLMDTSINKNYQLIEKKISKKSGLMQKLVSGETRLKGFETSKWFEHHLGSLGETYTGLTGKTKEDFGKGKPYIPYLNIFFNYSIDTSNLDHVKINESDKQNRVKYGDILFTVSSETQNEVGMASVLLENIDELYLNSFCFGFRLHDFEILTPEFSSYFFRANLFRKEVYKLSQGATRYNLSKTQLMKLKIVLPSIEEQKAIAQVLQAADTEIKLLKAKADKLREKKKGLMQQLLTGKVRLNVNNLE
jgi:type I restriction enzyme S subunit